MKFEAAYAYSTYVNGVFDKDAPERQSLPGPGYWGQIPKLPGLWPSLRVLCSNIEI
jgi:hypothetical protein